MKVKKLLELFEGKGLVSTKRHGNKAIVIQMVGMMVMMMFVGMIRVVMVPVGIVGIVMVLTMVVSPVAMMMIVLMVMGSLFGIGLGDGLI